MALLHLAAGHLPGCKARLRTTRCIREDSHPDGHVFVASEYGHVDEDGRDE